MTTELHQPGAKDDAGKIDLTYLIDYFPRALELLPLAPMPGDALIRLYRSDFAGAAKVVLSELQAQLDPTYDCRCGSSSHLIRAIHMYPSALVTVCQVAQAGAKKYTRGGWRVVPDGINRYRAAYLRHWFDRNIKKETHSHDMGLLHLGHEAWNLLAITELSLGS